MSDPIEWPSYHSGPKEHVHALGVISLNFNYFEHLLLMLLEQHLDFKIARHVFTMLNNSNRPQLIREAFKIYEGDAEVTGCVDAALRYFSVCVENRNNLAHGRLCTYETDLLRVEKTTRGQGGFASEFLFKLEDLRQVADEIMIGADFVAELSGTLRGRKTLRQGTATATTPLGMSPLPRPALPSIPQMPRKIIPLRPL